MMDIIVSKGVGSGDTKLAAFDNALKEAGIHNFNLLKLSSIIPPNSNIIEEKFVPEKNTFGNKLFVVLAEERTDLIGRSIAAGIGWYQWGDRRGVFAEHHDIVESPDSEEAKSNVEMKLKTTIRNLCEFRNIEFSKAKLRTSVSYIQVKTKPTCVLVAAVYKAETW